MASKSPSDNGSRPQVGDTLIVIHDFQARSSDELSLAKGDRVELIERDDEFGDGWFLGRHILNRNTGLFPEVYTRQAPNPSTTGFTPAKPAPAVAEVSYPTWTAPHGSSQESTRLPSPVAVGQVKVLTASLPPKTPSLNPSTSPNPVNSGAPSPSLGRLENDSQDSQVLHETLNVIDEHITDLRSPPSNGALRPPTDSGSEYSAPLEQRMSYIQGEETDEEEDQAHTLAEVNAWNPEDVAEFLFTVGVEKHHCEVFRDQEISGEVLLGMDQSSLFIKAFDLGSVGRRLKTWHKIKALQDEVVNSQGTSRKTSQTYDADIVPDDTRRTRSRNNTLTSPVINRPVSINTHRLSATQTPRPSPGTLHSPVSSLASHPSPTQTSHVRRPSAASVRDLNHSRRHSSTTDFRVPGIISPSMVPALNTSRIGADLDGTHKKQPSFDRNWTLGSAFVQSSPRPLSSAGLRDMTKGPDTEPLQDSAVDLDRGYFSGTEVDGRKRNVLKKREGASHSKKTSYTEEQRVRSATALSKHSRFGSVDSFRDGPPSAAIQKYFGVQGSAHRRTASTNTAESSRALAAGKDGPSPTVTHLEPGSASGRSLPSPTAARHPGFHSDWLSSVTKPLGKGRSGKRAISDRLVGNRQKDAEGTDVKEPSLDSPAWTGSSTPSMGPSLDLESPGTGKSSSTAATSASKANKKKNKKETSAYTRGLLKISPQEAKKDADYYGWMSKKSSNLMTTWKPRLFVLRGRRLAYYYSEEDDQEKGLIDISFHRVLPASNEKLTGLHATITGAVGGPSIPIAHIPQGSGESPKPEKGDDSPFIFKLIPPRAGLSRAVNFTKPTVHYFAVPNLNQGRLWMGALMKATIDRDDTQPITTTYQQKTISLSKAKQMRHRPPALMNLDEASEEDLKSRAAKSANGLGIFGEADSGVSGLDKLGGAKLDSPAAHENPETATSAPPPPSA